MKPIHECAVIKDGNKRVAYMISEADSHVNITSKPWKIVDASTFENMVANNKVQYLVWENNTIKCRYDLDELKLLKKISTPDMIKRTQEDYWSMDAQFKYRHIQAANNGQGFAVCLAQIQKMFGMYMIPIIIYGNTYLMSTMIQEFELSLGKPLNKTFKHNGDTIGQWILPLIYFYNFLEGFGEKYRLMFNTSTLKFFLKDDIKTRRIPILQGKTDPEKILQVINKLDAITLDNERAIGI